MTSVHDQQMDPDSSPNTIASGVRRVNNLPLYLIGGAVLVFLIVMMLVAADRANQQNRPDKEAKENTGDTNKFADKIAGNHNSGIIPAAEPTKPLIVPELSKPQPDVSSLSIARADNLDAPPLPPNQMGGNQPHAGNDETLRIRQMKLQQLQEAIKAHTGVQIQAPRSTGSPPGGVINSRDSAIVRQTANADPTEIYKIKLAQLQNSGVVPDPEGQGGEGDNAPQLIKTGASSEANTTEQFGHNGQGDRWQLNAQMEVPRSPYELRAGFVVPGTLISGINSELPGQIMAQVAQNVYDTATGKYLLLPQGARLVGAYSSQVAYGQARVLVAWQRIVFPDGKAMDIGAMPGADSAGYAGFHDLVDNHYLRIFGSALIMSAVTAGVMYSQQSNQTTATGSGVYTPNASSTLSQALGQQLGHVTAQMIQKNMNIAPTLEIRPGFRFNIIVTKDLTFTKPYQSFDY
ncbi:MAG: TrbI/VirB10 family protein [Methylovulum sp.]|nr:MAG: TrbI/VirB10 family protein [Methylovulum sp.]